MLKLTPIKTNHAAYPFIEELMHNSFPIEERRADDLQRANTDHNPLFTVYLITDEKENGEQLRVGLITVWNLDGFHYVEHFATSPDVRNHGYGKKVMEHLLNVTPGIVVLEVEIPEDELTKRRVGFYNRCGFKLCNKEYIQPAYSEGGQSIPLRIMFHGIDNLENDFDHIVRNLYREVYSTYL